MNTVMKPNLILLLAFLILRYGTQIAWGQIEDSSHHERSQFLLQTPVKFSGFMSPMHEYSVVQGDFSIASGGGMALLINQQFFLGIYGLSSNHHDRQVIFEGQLDRVQTNFSHGGLWIGYIHQSQRLVHYGVSTKVAGGTIRLEDTRGLDHHRQLTHDGVFVFTPQMEIELNVLKWLKLNASLGYRTVSGVELFSFSNTEFSSLQGTFTMMFGWFDQ